MTEGNSANELEKKGLQNARLDTSVIDPNIFSSPDRDTRTRESTSFLCEQHRKVSQYYNAAILSTEKSHVMPLREFPRPQLPI